MHRQRGKTGSNRAVALYAIVGALALTAVLLYLIRIEAFGAASKPNVTEHRTERSAWLADWRWEAGTEDLQTSAGGLYSLQVFAAYFDPADKLKFTDEFRESLPRIREIASENGLDRLYLTIVNDIVFPDGTESQKDTALVTRLTASGESRGRHIDEIVQAAVSYGFQGVELDYEQIGKDDWPNFVRLVRELHSRLLAEGLAFRVVFEPRAPLETLDLPEGPVYVMMAYNLHGGHSGPGPKANDAFVAEQASRMAKLSVDSYIALSAGGFDWHGKTGKAVSVTERQAAELANRFGAEAVRDSSSGALRFEYEDEEGIGHEVWYADGTTFSQWIRAAQKKGIHNIAIWRLDELGRDTLAQLKGTSS